MKALGGRRKIQQDGTAAGGGGCPDTDAETRACQCWQSVTSSPNAFPSVRGCPRPPAELRGGPHRCLQQPSQRRDLRHPPARYHHFTENRCESAKKRTPPASFCVNAEPESLRPCRARVR